MNELARIDNYCTLNTTNLTFKRDVSKEEWMDVFKALKQVEGCVQFWIGDCLAYRQQKWGMYDDIAEETGYDKQTLKNIKSVSENVPAGVRNSGLSFTHHREVASLPPEKQETFLKKAVEEHLSVRDLRQAIRVDGNTSSTPELKKDKKYRVIYADPPWSYGNQMPKGTTTPSDYYNTMSTEAICALPVRDITDDNAILFLWTTSPHLRESFDVIDAWGFDYKTSFIWDKVKHNMGHYNSVRHEFLLICVKGSCTPDNIQLFDSVVSIERTEHSIKPEYFREIIDTLYTWGNKIELFARTTVAGWEVYGNEV